MDADTVHTNSEGIYTALVSPHNDVYSKVDQTSFIKPLQHTVHLSTDKRGKNSQPYRLAAVCLGVLCALLLTAITALCFHYTSLSRKESTMERDLKELIHLRVDYSTMSKALNHLQKVLQRFPFLHQNCIFSSQKRVCGPCPQGWEKFSSSCYYFSTEERSWRDSRNDCLIQGADLVMIESEEEQEFITKHTNGHHYWIGLSDSETEGTWLWVDRTPLQKGFWRSGQPDDHYMHNGAEHPDADCAVTVHGENIWTDRNCSFKRMYVCETDAFFDE